MKAITVGELIEELKKFDPSLPVAFPQWSEYLILEEGDIGIMKLCEPRNDGWVACSRPDKGNIEYLVIPSS